LTIKGNINGPPTLALTCAIVYGVVEANPLNIAILGLIYPIPGVGP
jgi:hypothetical protein